MTWEETSDPAARRDLDIWTYCYLWSYVAGRLARDESAGAADMDVLFESTYDRVERGLRLITETDRYTHWVSVVCRNTHLNFVRDRAARRLRPPQMEADREATDPDGRLDAAAVRLVTSRAIARLPLFLRTVARLRLLDEVSYEEIGRITGKDLPTIRAYVHKAIIKLRLDPALTSLVSG